MRVNALITWLALAATWVWLGNAYINGTAALRILQSRAMANYEYGACATLDPKTGAPTQAWPARAEHNCYSADAGR
jgi:hypothetical protein